MADEQEPKGDDKVAKGLKGGVAKSNNAVKAALDKQPKIKINIRRPDHVKKGMHFNEVVSINGHSYKIPTGVFVEVPEEVYLILVRGGKVQPVREEDEHEVPAIVTQEGPEYQFMSGGQGSMANPIVL
jgi:hypothetical protein